MELTGGLSGERGRWKETGEILENEIKTLEGDILLSVGYLNYMGAFTIEFRQKILKDYWLKSIEERIPSSGSNYKLINCLSN